jgi:hypothetical protein
MGDTSRRLFQQSFDAVDRFLAGSDRAGIGLFGEIDCDGGERGKSSREMPGRIGHDAQKDVALHAYSWFEGVFPFNWHQVSCSHVAINLSPCDKVEVMGGRGADSRLRQIGAALQALELTGMGEESSQLRSLHQAGLQIFEPSRLEVLTHTPERLRAQPWSLFSGGDE